MTLPAGLQWEEVRHGGWATDGFASSIAETFGTQAGPKVRRARVPGGWFVVVGDDVGEGSLTGWFYPDPDHRWSVS